MSKKKVQATSEFTQEIFCPIHNDWFDYEGGLVIPPDVLAEVSACGHNLPAGEIRDKEQPEPETEIPTFVDQLTEEEEKALEELQAILKGVS